MPQTSIEPPGIKASIEEVRRRIRDRYYDRPDVRRILTHLILRQLARKPVKRPRTA